MINPIRDKRAYIAYMNELLLKQKEDPDATIIEGYEIILVGDEIKRVDKIINDLDFFIRTHE